MGGKCGHMSADKSPVVTNINKPSKATKPSNLPQALRLQVPVVVRLAERSMSLKEVLALVPGAIIELPKNAEAELDLMVNNTVVGTGQAVKVGENFGIRITKLGNTVSGDSDSVAAMQR